MISYQTLKSVLRRPVECRMCRRIAAVVLLAIIAIEAVILIPSYWNYERDLLLRLERVGWAEVSATYRATPQDSPRELAQSMDALIADPDSNVLGLAIYSLDGEVLAAFGTAPELTLEEARSQGLWTKRGHDGIGCDVVWDAAKTGLPVNIVARLDAGWIPAELVAFVWRITGLVLLISAFVTTVTMGILGRSVLMPLLSLRSSLTEARQDPSHADDYVITKSRSDELGEATDAVNQLLERVARTYREELAPMTAMASQASDAILAYDGAGRILYTNPACLKLCGVETVEEMEAANLPRLRFEGDSRDVGLPESLITGAYSREAQMIVKSGDTVSVFVNAARPPAESDAAIQFYASISDISELQTTRERLERQNLDLETANRAKTEFLTNMSHELRTPLNAIIGFSEVLRDGLFGPLGNDRYSEYVEDIHTSGTHLLAIISDILDLAKIDAGKRELQESDIMLSDLVESVLPMVRGHAETGELTLEVAVPQNLPMLRADEKAVKQMLLNLFSNAVKFTEPGGTVGLTAKIHKGTLVVSVTDTGIGMAEEDLEMALEAFGQVDGNLDREHEGTGLGLSLVVKLAELHGAVLKLESEPGTGTTASIVFPSRRVLGANPCLPASVARQEEARANAISGLRI